MSDDKVWLPVRCCCDPKKIFGFLRLSADDVRRFPFKAGALTVDGHPLELRRFLERPPLSMLDDPAYAPAFGQTEELAVYSDDRPRAFWRGLPDFIEAAP